jgi:hypothetical protein
VAKRRLPTCHFLAFSFSFLASGLCGLLRCTFPHSSTKSQTLWGGTASLHCGQIFNAGATRKSWLLRIPCFDGDLRLFGTATNALSESSPVAAFFWRRVPLSGSTEAFQERVRVIVDHFAPATGVQHGIKAGARAAKSLGFGERLPCIDSDPGQRAQRVTDGEKNKRHDQVM